MARNTLLRLLASLLIVAAFSGCGAKDETEAVRKLIDIGAKFAEAHQIGDLMDLTVKDFTAQPGHHSAADVRAILFSAFHHYGNFSIRYPRPTVTLESGTANGSAVVYFMIVSRDRSIPGLKELYDDPQRWLELAGEKADLYQLKLDLIKNGSRWQVRQATLEGFKGWGF